MSTHTSKAFGLRFPITKAGFSVTRRKHQVNEAKLASLKPFMDQVERDLRRIRAEVDLLNRDYLEERELAAERCPNTRRHAGLYLSFEKRYSPNGDFPLGSVSWRVGKARHNAKLRSGRLRNQPPRTKRVRAGGKSRHYRRADLRAAMPFAQPWEVDLTLSFEKEARKLREFCFYLQKVAEVVTWYPPIPSIPRVGELKE